MSATRDDRALEELLGAYALDSCDSDEIAEIETMLARRPDVAREAARLTSAAAWIGATEALAAPPSLRESLLARARTRRAGEADGALRAYMASTERLAATVHALPDAALDKVTPNGLTARDLVVHLAAQESLLAQAAGVPTIPDITHDDVETRTAALVERLGDQPFADVRAVWRQAVDAVERWASDPSTKQVMLPWLAFELPRDNLLVARAFENWIHRDDLRGAAQQSPEVPPPNELREMADLSVGTLPMGLAASGRARSGKRARVVLTGDGGGEWTIAMDGSDEPASGPPDVTFTGDVVDWCRLAGERLAPDQLRHSVEGDEALAADLIAAAPAFATL